MLEHGSEKQTPKAQRRTSNAQFKSAYINHHTCGVSRVASVRTPRRRNDLTILLCSQSFADIDAKDFAIMMVNSRINTGSQNTTVSKRLSVCRREIEVVHLKLFPIHRDDISFAVPGRGLLTKDVNRSFDNVILPVPIRSDQTINVSENMRKIVQVEPKQTPNDSEASSDQAFRAVVSPSLDQNPHASDENRYTDEKSGSCLHQNAVTVFTDLENSDEV